RDSLAMESAPGDVQDCLRLFGFNVQFLYQPRVFFILFVYESGEFGAAPTDRLLVGSRHGIRVNGYLSWRISSRNLGCEPARFRRVLTLLLDLLARTRPRAKRRTMAMFLAPCPVR